MGEQTILGLDLGTTSVGWALVGGDAKPREIIAAGVRIFPEGMDRTRGEKSLNQDRREARSLRRQGYRRARRKTKLRHALADAGLLPKDEDTLRALMNREDPYHLRARALDEKLDAWQAGRALYHLGQRRGYLSNRKTGTDKEDGKVAEGIGELAQAMQQAGARTLGEYLAGLDAHKQRLRGRYTSRKMYLEEFERIWAVQSGHHPKAMDAANRARIHKAIFEQRPLKPQKHLIGWCGFEPERKRVAKATLVAQEFRLWQTINSLRAQFNDGSERFLKDKERAALYDKLASVRSLSWDRARKVLAFPDSASFNLEPYRKSGLLGNQSAAIVSSAIGKKFWNALGERGREQLVYDLLNIDQDEALARLLRRRYSLPEEAIGKLLSKSLELPKGYLHVSSKAARKISAELRRMATPNDCGLSYDQACAAAGYDHTQKITPGNLERLPFPGRAARDKAGNDKPIQHDSATVISTVNTDELRNPLVERALYQLRRVVNALIGRHGKPDIIRVELARDLKSNRKQREDHQRTQKQNEEANLRAESALKEYGYPHPTHSDKLKYRLWEECAHVCPYTGRSMSMDDVFGDHPQFDIEHIIPYSRCLDDGYMNKTLCYRPENAHKGNLTPYEARARSNF